MSNYNSIKSLFNDIAVKIQDKLGNHTDKIKADDFPSAIENISGGEWLPSADTVLATFARRQSGGDGPATIEKIYGKTEVWNQLVQNGDFSDGTTGWTAVRGTIAASSGKCVFTITDTSSDPVGCRILYQLSLVATHKYLALFGFTPLHNGYAAVEQATAGIIGSSNKIPVTAGVAISAGIIVTAINDANNVTFGFGFNSDAYTVGEQVEFSNVRLIDLTKMYGEGKEPSTVEEFLSMHPEALTAPYDAGSLLPVKAEKILTQGVNQWDEEWEGGSFNTTTGENIDWTASSQIRSKNLIPVIGGQTYFFKTAASGGTLWVMLYDSSMTIIDASALGYGSSGNCFSIGNNTATLPANAAYLKFYVVAAYGTTYNHDICINISDSSINGQYFPHHNSDVGLPILKHFPTGLRGVGDSYDEITPRKATKRRAVVDLGTLDYSYSAGIGGSNLFRTSLPADAADGNYLVKANILCAKYTTTSGSLRADKCVYISNRNLDFLDSSYTDAATFKTAMSGVELDYPLAEPIETDINEDMTYLPQLGGTEEVSPISAEFKAEIRYARKINE